MERTVLITNLLDVSIETGLGNVMTYTNALVLSDRGDQEFGPRYRACGYHNEAINPTFTLMLPSEDRARPGLIKIEGLWGRGTKGTRGAEKKPGSWRVFLAEHAPEVLPELPTGSDAKEGAA